MVPFISMRELIIIYLILLRKLINCGGFLTTSINSSVIDDGMFDKFDEDWKLGSPVIIGSFEYNYLWLQVLKFNFSAQSRYAIAFKNMTYPLVVDVPGGMLSDDLIMRNMTKETSPKIKVCKDVEDIINALKMSKEEPLFQMENGISAKPIKGDANLQLLITWNAKKTYAILNFRDVGKIHLNLGRGLAPYNFSNDIPITGTVDGRLIYEISTNKMIKIGCQPVSPGNTQTFQLTMNKYRLSSLGSEKVYLQGPCIKNSTVASLQKLQIKRKTDQRIITTTMEFDIDLNSFHLITPFLWYPGIYEFKISFEDSNFITDVEIYSYQNPNQKYDLKWNESSEMNNPYFNKSELTLLPKSGSEIKSLHFYIIDLINPTQVDDPLLLNKVAPYLKIDDYLQVPLRYLVDDRINVLQHIGFFAMTDILNETTWTEPFSLIWWSGFVKQIFSDSVCKNHLQNSEKDIQYSCPINSEKVFGLQSTFRKMDLIVNTFTPEFEQFDCFSEVLPNFINVKYRGRGLTCCYFKESKYLVYGQDFYLRNRKFFGSYSWGVSPFNDVLKHFLRDRIPILSCCTLIENYTLCTNYWNQRHQISVTKITQRDYNADVFGDPHFIPYKATSEYSFLGLGQFDMITTKSNEFQLQGRFFYEVEQSSSLKAIAFSIPSTGIIITTALNIISTLQWNILIRKSNNESHQLIAALPFQDEYVHIFQNADTSKLHIYVHLESGSNIYIELERFPYYKTLLEYINMRIHLSNNFQEIISGGLFGKIDNIPDGTSIYERGTDKLVSPTSLRDLQETYNFVRTWETNEEISLFFDKKFFIKSESFEKKIIMNQSLCENLEMCNIDLGLYKTDIMYNTTLNAYKSRKKLDNDWRLSFSYENVCDHPKWKGIQLNSTNYIEGGNLTVSGCLDPLMKMKNPNQVLICKKSPSDKIEWYPDPIFDGELCENVNPKPNNDSKRPENTTDIIMYSSIGGAIALFLIVLAIIIVVCFILKRNRRARSNSKLALGTSLSSNIPMDDVYDNYVPSIKMDNEYATYAQIQKQPKA